MKKFFAIFVAIILTFSFVACGGGKKEDNEENTIKVGMVCIGDENTAYDRNFYTACEAAKDRLAKKGINVQWVFTYNHAEGEVVTEDCITLAEDGCQIVILNSYGQESAMFNAAEEYPDVLFISLTNEGSRTDGRENTINAFPSVYEGRFLAGVAAGCKLNELINNNTITPEQAVMGYVGAFPFAEVISGYTAFYLGAKSVCPSVTMLVNFVESWGDVGLESVAANVLVEKGAVLLSQHSDTTSPASVAENRGVYHVGYNVSMIDVAKNASIISTRIDWTNYFEYVIETVYSGGTVVEDYIGHGIADGDVVMTELNEDIAAPDTAEKISEAMDLIKSGALKVFDTSTFTVNGEPLTESLVDMTGDFVGDEGYNAVFDGYYHESYFKSAPAFAVEIDGITKLND